MKEDFNWLLDPLQAASLGMVVTPRFLSLLFLLLLCFGSYLLLVLVLQPSSAAQELLTPDKNLLLVLVLQPSSAAQELLTPEK